MPPLAAPLRVLRERMRQATAGEVEARWKLLVQQLETLARVTAQELARKGTPDPAVLCSEVESLDRSLHEVSSGSVELFACRLTSQQLSGRPAGRRRRGGRRAALRTLEDVRLDARTLFEWAKADLWTGVARRAIVEANRSALDLERESPATLCRVRRTLARSPGRGRTSDELAQLAEDLAFQELGRILAVGHGLGIHTRSHPLQQVGVQSARGVLSRLAPQLRSRVEG